MKPDNLNKDTSAEGICGYWLWVLFLLGEKQIRVGMFLETFYHFTLKCGVCWDNLNYFLVKLASQSSFLIFEL